MILEKQKDIVELQDGETQESFNTEIDFDSAEFLKQMLSKFYSDPIGSLIRETTSNALDSHREVNSTEPIIVSFGSDNQGNYEFSVEDFGVGVNKETINNILRKYGKSTKRQAINQLGAYGLGFKSPLAYNSSFYFIGRKNGVETSCMMFEGEEDIKIDILYEKPTTERNGCKVIVPVKSRDRYDFEKGIETQLCYFENVYFNVNNISNDFTIYRDVDFQYSELNKNNDLHICLDNVYYPIDFQKLGIPTINTNIGLRFSLTDGIYPTPNRESIKYSVEAMDIIKAKIQKVADWFVDSYNKSFKDNDDIFKLLNHYDYGSKYLNISPKISIEFKDLLRFTSPGKDLVEPSLVGLNYMSPKKVYDIKHILVANFIIGYRIDYSLKLISEKYNRKLSWSDFRGDKLFVYNDKIPNIKKEYIKEICKNTKSAKLYYLSRFFELGSANRKPTNSFYYQLDLGKFPKNKWRDVIKEFYYLQSLLTKDVIDVDKLVVPQSFIDSKKVQRVKVATQRKMRETGQLISKAAYPLEIHSSTRNCKFVTEYIDIAKIGSSKTTIVYTSEENKDVMDKMFKYLPFTKNIKFHIFSERELGKVLKLKKHNLISIEDFMLGKHKGFIRIGTALLIKSLVKKHGQIFSYKGGVLKKVSTDFYKKIEDLNNYANENVRGASNDQLALEVINILQENNLFDPEIYNTYLEVKKVLEQIPYLQDVIQSMGLNESSITESSSVLLALVDIFKYHKLKVNLEHYLKPVIESVTEEEVLESLI